MHSSTRPHRGSRMTSSTGARPWWMPRARIDAPISAPISSTSAGVEGRTPRQRGREGGGRPGRQPGEALLVHERGDAEPGPGDQAALPLPQPRGPLDRVDRPGAVRPGQVAQPVPGGLVEPGPRRRTRPGAARRPRRRPSPRSRRSGRASPPASSGRAGRARGRDAVAGSGRSLERSGRRSRSGPRRVGGEADGGRRGAGAWSHPLTAPWRPLTIRRCMARKKTSAGIIARVVNANTPAVSEEYCDEKSATPRGSVFMSPCSRSSGSR